MKKLLLILSVLLLVAGCASKKYTKKAVKFEESGLYEDAAEYYYQAVKKKDSNVEAKLGLRKNGQLTLDRKLSDFSMAYKQADYKKAVYNYLEADKYYKKVKSVKVDLDFPDHYKEYYEEAKGDYLNKKYADGVDKLNREDFTAALSVFEEINKIDADYKDVKELYITAKYEPMYRDANQYLETGLYRKAYYTFENIIKGAGTYKQSVALKDEAQEKGTISVLVVDLGSSIFGNSRFAQTATTELKGELSKLNNPFLKIVDQSAINANIIKDGKVNMQAANLAGVNAILSGDIVIARRIKGDLNKEEKRGYLKEINITKNAEGEEVKKTVYHKIIYWEYTQESSAQLKINYSLTSTSNNSVLVSDAINLSNSDKIHYAVFDGDKDKIIPGYWKFKNMDSKEDIKNDSSSDLKKLENLFKADKEVKSPDILLNNLLNEAVSKITNDVNNYNPEK